MSATRALVAALLAVLLASGTVAAGELPTRYAKDVAASDLVSTTIGPIQSDVDPQPIGRTTQLRATVEPADTGGTVTFYRIDGGDQIELGTVPVVTSPYVSPHWSYATLDFPADLGVGAYPIVATFNGTDSFSPSTSDTFVQDVGPRPTETTLLIQTPVDSADQATVPQDQQMIITAQTRDTGYLSNPLPPSGHLSIRVDGTEVASDDTMSVTVYHDTRLLTPGVHTVEATYTGSADYAGSSVSRQVTVVAGSVQASGVKLDVTTFYPITDGYRDVVHAVGTLLEPASVKVVVYDPSGSKRKTITLGTRTGAYSVAWNGRTSGGTLLSSGKYRIVQTLTDSAGSVRTVTSYVNLSKRKLVFKTTYVTKRVTSYSAKGTYGGGKISVSSAGYLKVTGWGTTSGWAGVGWQFTLPSAVYYKSMSFQTYANAPASVPQNYIGLQDFRSCVYSSSTTWNESCFGRWKTLASTGTTWHSASGASYNRSGRYVRGMVSAYGPSIKIYKVRVKVTYGVWAS